MREISEADAERIDASGSVEQTAVSASGGSEETPESNPPDVARREIAVDVCGAVRTPGLYRLEEGSRIDDAIRAAGGLAENAAQEGVNLAYILKDGMQIRIPTEEEVLAYAGTASGLRILVEESSMYSALAVPETQAQEAAEDGRLDLNTASLEELMKLPGIGEQRARAILAYREQSGGFCVPEDLMKVSGIKAASYEKLRDLVTVR